MQVGDIVGHTTKKGLGVILEFRNAPESHLALVHFANNRCAKWYNVNSHLEPYLAGGAK